MNQLPLDDQRTSLQKAANERGLQGVLALLNDRTQFRYSAVLHSDHDVLRIVCTFDRNGRLGALRRAIAFDRSLSQHAMRDGQYAVADCRDAALNDGHPYGGLLVAYAGVVLTGDSGQPVGSFCHFDTEAREIDPRELRFMREAAETLVPLVTAHVAANGLSAIAS